MRINNGTKDTVRYLLGMGDEHEAIRVLKDRDLSDEEARSIVDWVEPMTTEEAFAYMNSD